MTLYILITYQSWTFAVCCSTELTEDFNQWNRPGDLFLTDIGGNFQYLNNSRADFD